MQSLTFSTCFAFSCWHGRNNKRISLKGNPQIRPLRLVFSLHRKYRLENNSRLIWHGSNPEKFENQLCGEKGRPSLCTSAAARRNIVHHTMTHHNKATFSDPIFGRNRQSWHTHLNMYGHFPVEGERLQVRRQGEGVVFGPDGGGQPLERLLLHHLCGLPFKYSTVSLPPSTAWQV